MRSDLNFNSIKVRLTPPQEVNRQGFCKFQFHKGTINPIQQMTIREFCLNFNSIKVRLTQLVEIIDKRSNSISIP